MPQAFALGAFEQVYSQLDRRLRFLAKESGSTGCVLPIGLFLVLPESHGGDTSAVELVRRFHLLDKESENVIDFYYLGWTFSKDEELRSDSELNFNLNGFENCRKNLKKFGVTKFAGNADLILLDAEFIKDRIVLHFERVVQIDLAAKVAAKEIPTLGSFLQEIVGVAHEVRAAARSDYGPVFSISDKLGLAFGKESILDFILDKWGKLIGAKRLKDLAVRKLGAPVDLLDEIQYF